ncbi:hypothetical protein LEADMM271B_05165 [Leclercia adecarboxylata]
MFPLTPTLSPKRRGSRPCQYFCRAPSAHREVACFLSPQPSPKRGEGADRANIFVGLPQPTGRSHVPSHPNPLPKEEREPTVPICCRDPSAHREAACSPSPQPSPQRGEGADRTNIRRGSRPCPFLWGSHRHVEEGQGESIRPHRSRLTYASFNKLRAVG